MLYLTKKKYENNTSFISVTYLICRSHINNHTGYPTQILIIYMSYLGISTSSIEDSMKAQWKITDQQQIELYTAFDVNRLVFSFTKLLWLQCLSSYYWHNVFCTTQKAEIIDFQMFGTIEQVSQIKVLYVVASYNVWVNFPNKFCPTLKFKNTAHIKL